MKKITLDDVLKHLQNIKPDDDQALLKEQRIGLFVQRVGEIIVNKFNRYYSISPVGGHAQNKGKT